MPHNTQDLRDNLIEPELKMAITDDFIERKSGFTIHSLFIVLMLMFIFSLAFVLGLDYFYDLSSWRGQTLPSMCPAVSGMTQQLNVCLLGYC